MLILTLLLVKWTDKLDNTFGSFVFDELLKIIGLTILALAGMGILVHILNKAEIEHIGRKKVVFSVLLTLLISSFLYTDYAIKLQSRLTDRTRASLISKIEAEPQMLAYGTKADNLSLKEYVLLADVAKFPNVPETAENISYLYSFDGFLPDYTFRLTYEVPATTQLEEIEFKKGDFSKIQKFQIIGERKLVTYEEVRW